MKKKFPVKKIVVGAGMGVLVVTGSAFYLAYKIIHPKRRKQELTPKKFGMRYKNLQFKSKDGTLLKGWLVEAKEPRGLIVLSHGYSYDKQSMLDAVRDLYKNNYSTLLFDYRGHGESGGDKTTIGVEEQEDLLAAIDLAKKFSRKVGVIGISMGAATAIMALARIKGIKCLVVDSSFAKLKDIVHRKSHMLTGLIIKFMKSQGVDVEKSQPIDVVNKIGVPVFFIHGEKDSLVPFEDSVKLFEKAKVPKELWIVKNAIHGRSYFSDKKEYSKEVLEFLNRYF